MKIAVRLFLVVLVASVVAPVPAAASHHIDIVGFAYSPATVQVPLGESVTWHNHDSAPHTVTTTSAPAAFDSGSMSNGVFFGWSFTTAGAYDYFCTIHPFMIGRIEVVGPDPGGIVFDPPLVDFGALEPGASAEATVTVTNTSGGAGIIGSITAAGGPFAVGAQTCTQSSLAPGGSCTIVARFQPVTEGEWNSGSLTVTSDIGQGGYTLPLLGIGDATAPVVAHGARGATLIRPNGALTGTATDALAGVATVDLEFQAVLGGLSLTGASLSCDAKARSCTWSATGPSAPGVYVTRATGADRAGNRSAAVELLVVVA